MPTVQYIPREGGGFQPFAKCPANGRKHAPGEHNTALVGRDSRSVSVVDANGVEQFRHQTEDFVETVKYQPQADRYLVHHFGGVDVISARDGALLGQVTPDKMDIQSNMQTLADGRLMLNVGTLSDEGGQLIMLQPDLQPAWDHPTQLQRARILELDNGAVAAFSGPTLEVCNARGEIIHRSDKAMSDPQLKDGKLVYLEAAWMKGEGRVRERSHGMLLCQHDLKTGLTLVTPTTEDVEACTPLPDGRFLMSERGIGHMALVLHDADGKRTSRHKFEGYLFQLDVSQDGKFAYAMDADPLVTPPVYRLQKVDLETMTATKVHEGNDDFIATALTDGRTALFTRQGITLLEEGLHFKTPDELLTHLGPDVLPANNTVEARVSNYTSPGPGPGRWDELFTRVNHRLKLGSAATMTAKPGQPFVTPDSCVNFMLPALDALPAAVAAATRGVKVGDLFRTDAMPAWLRQDGTQLKLKDGEKEHSIVGPFSHVLPFTVEGRPVVAAARDNGLTWWDPTRVYGESTYSLNEKIVSLEPARDGASVLARTESGQVLHMVPESVSQFDKAPEEQEPDKSVGTLKEDEQGIRLPGVFIRRKKV